MSIALDHLVVAAATLERGVAGCEAALGASPGTGGWHALFVTHTRWLKITSGGRPSAYLEIVVAMAR